MVRAIAMVVCLVVVSGFAKHQNQNFTVSIATVENFDEYLNEHPEVKSLQELDKVVEEKSEPLATIPTFKVTYELGNRTAGRFENFWNDLVGDTKTKQNKN